MIEGDAVSTSPNLTWFCDQNKTSSMRKRFIYLFYLCIYPQIVSKTVPAFSGSLPFILFRKWICIFCVLVHASEEGPVWIESSGHLPYIHFILFYFIFFLYFVVYLPLSGLSESFVWFLNVFLVPGYKDSFQRLEF